METSDNKDIRVVFCVISNFWWLEAMIFFPSHSQNIGISTNQISNKIIDLTER